jgi:hypothetical protein
MGKVSCGVNEVGVGVEGYVACVRGVMDVTAFVRTSSK